MSILLRIYFAGLIAFLPGEADQDLTVLLVDARDGYAASDGMAVESHSPLLLARAAACDGDCDAEREAIADLLYQRLVGTGHVEPTDHLHEAILAGGAWQLADSDLSIVTGVEKQRGALRILRSTSDAERRMPLDPIDRKHFDWVADIGQIAPEAAEIDPDVLAEHPRKGLIVGRLRLSEGTVWTHRLLRVGDQVPQIVVKPLRGDHPEIAYSQALAHWIVVEIRIPAATTVKLIDTNFVSGERQRAMDLSPVVSEGERLVEVAILNAPLSWRAQTGQPPPAIDEYVSRHFEMYYELSRCRPANKRRPVPHVASTRGVQWSGLHPKESELSDFVDSIIPPPGKGLVSPPVCPAVQFP